MGVEEVQKQRAIETHSMQAGEFAVSYQDLEQDAFGSCFTYSRRRLDHFLARYLPERGEGLKVLDVGCGTGRYMASLRQRGYLVAGVDGSEEMLAHARRDNPGVEIKQADVDQLPFADGSFDFAICIEVLRYLPSATRALAEMARVLKPGGVLLVTAAPVLNLNGYYIINRVASTIPVKGLVPLKQFFATSSGLRREVTKAGLEVTRIHGVYFGPINWIERLAPGILPAALRKWEAIDSRISDRPILREFANMFLVAAKKKE